MILYRWSLSEQTKTVSNSAMYKILTVDYYNMDERLECSQCLPGEPGITDWNAVAVRSSRQSDIHLGRCGRAHMLIRWSLPHKCFYLCVKKNFAVGLNCEIILTTKFCRSMLCSQPVLPPPLQWVHCSMERDAYLCIYVCAPTFKWPFIAYPIFEPIVFDFTIVNKSTGHGVFIFRCHAGSLYHVLGVRDGEGAKFVLAGL